MYMHKLQPSVRISPSSVAGLGSRKIITESKKLHKLISGFNWSFEIIFVTFNCMQIQEMVYETHDFGRNFSAEKSVELWLTLCRMQLHQ